MWTQDIPLDAIAGVVANVFLPVGRGALILILGGIAALLISILWSFATPRLAAITRARGGRFAHFMRPIVGGFVGALYAFITYWAGAGLAMFESITYTGINDPPFQMVTQWEMALVALGVVVGVIVARYRWHGAGLLGYVGLLSMIVGYVAYALTVTIPYVPQEERIVSYVLLGAEAGGLSLIAVFSFYTLDATVRRNWTRRPESIPYDPSHVPVVAFQVPVFNEPPDMVEETVAHLVRQDYPRDRFVVVLADDSTDESIRSKNREMCKRLGAHHVTREDRTGFKAGALNHVNRLLADKVELVAIIDADYWVAPDYLRSIVGYFTDPGLSFVQTPQDYRNIDESFLTRRYKHAEAYFYHGIMPSRNEENTIIFCGTMGIIRRSALDSVGGFAEDQICEDAEVSVRLAARGWRSLYIDQSFGKGLMPAVFEAYKKQFYRWAFGNVKILFSRTGTILRSNMTRRQKVDYMVSNLHWFDGFFVLAIALVLLYLGMGPILGYDAVTHHQRELALLGIVPVVLMADGIFRLHFVLKRGKGINLRQTLLVQGMWFAIKMTNVRAVTKAMLGFKSPFVRTPKSPGSRLSIPRAFFRSLRLTKVESAMGVALLTVAGFNFSPAQLAGKGFWSFLLPGWLGVYALFFLSAPIYAYLSYRTLAPARNDPVTQSVPAGRSQRMRVLERHRKAVKSRARPVYASGDPQPAARQVVRPRVTARPKPHSAVEAQRVSPRAARAASRPRRLMGRPPDADLPVAQVTAIKQV